MSKEEILDMMKIICEAQDQMTVAIKSLEVFNNSDNWNFRYTEQQSGRTEKFNYLNLDPRGIAYTGLDELRKGKEQLNSSWYKLREDLYKLEQVKKDN